MTTPRTPDDREPTSALELVGRRDLGRRVRAFVGSTASVWQLPDLHDQLALAATEVTAAAWCRARLPLRLELVHQVQAGRVVVSCSGRRRAGTRRPAMPPEWGAADAWSVLESLGLHVEVEGTADLITARIVLRREGPGPARGR